MMKNAQNDNAVAYMPLFAWAESDDHARVLRDGQETNTWLLVSKQKHNGQNACVCLVSTKTKSLALIKKYR